MVLSDKRMVWQGQDIELIEEAVESIEVQEPDWSLRIHQDCWQGHVGQHTMSVWQDFSPSQRAAIALDAAWRARDWSDQQSEF